MLAVYVSGLPGIGKTTAVKHLARTRPSEYVRLSFGEALREVADPGASVDSFRSVATTIVDRAAIEKATAVLVERLRSETTQVALIDSHAVTPALEGLRATPDTESRVTDFGYSMIAHLSAVGVEERILRYSGTEGRATFTAAQISTAEAVQLAVVTRYASICDCPLYVVTATDGVVEVADRLALAITAGLKWGARGS